MDALIWVGIGLGLSALLAPFAVVCWPMPRQESPKREAWLDTEVTYAAARAALPPHIRKDFHPDWPWLDPAGAPKEKADPLRDEIVELASGDLNWTRP
jgi:hypothetical protein